MNLAIETAKSIFLIISTLFPIVNPLGGSPIFLSLTRSYPSEARWTLSRAIAVNSLFLLIGSYLIGTHILSFFGISIPVVQIGGGIVVISSGWTLLKHRDEDERHEMHRNVTQEDLARQAFYPLTLPLTVGPGSISVAITLGANVPRESGFNFSATIAALIGMALIAVSILLCYGFSERLAKFVGATAMSVIMRLSSFLLVCIGIQIVWNGVSALLKTTPLGR
jgi:multiple antibiotic resistance protein